MARRHNGINHGEPGAEHQVVSGRSVAAGTIDLGVVITYAPDSPCPGGCGYRRTWCGCNGGEGRAYPRKRKGKRS